VFVLLVAGDDPIHSEASVVTSSILRIVGELGKNLSPSKLRSSLDSCKFVKVFGDDSLDRKSVS
jgi:hypothetical protein